MVGQTFIGVGVGGTDPTDAQSINYASSGMPGFPDDRYISNGAEGAVSYSIMGGYQWQRNAIWLPALSLGLGYTRASPEITGVIYENSLDDSKNFAFKYDVLQQLSMVTLKADLVSWHQLMPYVSVGAGVAVNKVGDYSDWPIPGATLQHRRYGFNSATNTNFADSFGAGFDYWFAHKTQISLGYQFISTGNIKTGLGSGTLSSNRLTNKLKTNNFSLQAMYFLD